MVCTPYYTSYSVHVQSQSTEYLTLYLRIERWYTVFTAAWYRQAGRQARIQYLDHMYNTVNSILPEYSICSSLVMVRSLGRSSADCRSKS